MKTIKKVLLTVSSVFCLSFFSAQSMDFNLMDFTLDDLDTIDTSSTPASSSSDEKDFIQAIAAILDEKKSFSEKAQLINEKIKSAKDEQKGLVKDLIKIHFENLVPRLFIDHFKSLTVDLSKTTDVNAFVKEQIKAFMENFQNDTNIKTMLTDLKITLAIKDFIMNSAAGILKSYFEAIVAVDNYGQALKRLNESRRKLSKVAENSKVSLNKTNETFTLKTDKTISQIDDLNESIKKLENSVRSGELEMLASLLREK